MNEIIIEWADGRMGARADDRTDGRSCALVSDRMITQTGKQSDQTDLLNNHRTDQQSNQRRNDRAAERINERLKEQMTIYRSLMQWNEGTGYYYIM